jgi:hypothetical protein
MTTHDDQTIVREFIQRELETISTYQKMILAATDPEVRRMLAHAMSEEKEHVAEGMQLLARLDAPQAVALREDHSPHFAVGGKGDVALIEFLGAAPPESAADIDPSSLAKPTVGNLRGRAQPTG